MYTRPVLGAVVAAIALNAPCSLGAPYPAATGGPDLAATARTLVNQCTGIKQGDLVLISGMPRDTELLENVAVEVRKVGAFPMIEITTERLYRRLIDEVPAQFDSQTNQFALKLNDLINARIIVEGTDNPKIMAGVPAERLNAIEKAGQPVMASALKHNIRTAVLGNGLYPTEGTAELYGMTKTQLTVLFWDAVNTDYNQLQTVGQSVQNTLGHGKEVRITNPNGTDLKFRIEGQPVFVSDGVISPEDASKGGAACQVWLPAGEVYTTPLPNTADGKVVIDRQIFQGKEIRNITLTFKDGKLTDMSAPSGLEPIKALYDAGDKGKDAFAFVDLGINSEAKPPANTKMQAWMTSGMVTIGVGNNTWAGGTNATSFSFSGFLPGSTVTIDGKTIVDNGTLKP